MTQAELATTIEVNQCWISFFENDRRVPSLALIVRLADALGCSADWLLGTAIGTLEGAEVDPLQALSHENERLRARLEEARACVRQQRAPGDERGST